MNIEKSGVQSRTLAGAKKTLAFLTAMCLFFSAVEFVIPKPFPFLRLGLANFPVILGFFILTPLQTVLLIVLKIFVQNLISGTLFSYTILFSVAGSFSSGLVMLALFNLLYRRGNRKISLVGISLAGSLFNSLAQLGISYLLIFEENTKYVAPFMLAAGFVTGLLLGFFAEYFTGKSKWFLMIQAEK
ncbi:MAG: Gx transporter family protein [Treponema sp.]